MNKLNIEAGKFYKTREGRKVRIYATDGIGPYTIHGAVEFTNVWRDTGWRETGRFWSNDTHDSDIISEWDDAPTFDWSKAAAWHKWVAMDEGGSWWAFVEKPKIGERCWSWSAFGENPKMGERCWPWSAADDAYSYIPPEYAPKWTGDWNQSLIERPTV